MHFPILLFYFNTPNDLFFPFLKSRQNPSIHEPFFDVLQHDTFYGESLLDLRRNYKQKDHPFSAVGNYFSGIFLSTLGADFIRKLTSRAAVEYA